MTKRLARLGSVAGVVVAAWLASAAGALAVPVPIAVQLGGQPHAVAVPADVVAAHPGGASGGLTAQAVLQPVGAGGAATNATERVSCWRAYFVNDNSIPFGTEREWINPYWCGNGSAMRGSDSGWHGQTCSILVSCEGESGVGTWYGCGYGCSSLGQQIDGHFAVHTGVTFYVTDTVLYELYPNGGYWSYTYHS